MTLDNFEARLLTELRTAVEANARPRWGRRLTAVAAGLAVALGALAVGLGRDGPAPAYAVTPNPDGSVTVSVSGDAEPREVKAALAKAGVPAEVVLIGPECLRELPAPIAQPGPFPTLPGYGTLDVSTGTLAPGQFLVVTFLRPVPSGARNGTGVGLAIEPVTSLPDCAQPV